MGVGKSSVAKELSKATELEYIDVDEMRWDFFSAQPDYDMQIVDKLFDDLKILDAFCYMKPYEARLVLHILDKYPCGVFDFGAGYTVYESDDLLKTVKSAFSKYDYIFFLRYSDNNEESLAELYRHEDIPKEIYYELNKSFINSPCNNELAKYTIDTKDKTIDEVTSLILKYIQHTE